MAWLDPKTGAMGPPPRPASPPQTLGFQPREFSDDELQAMVEDTDPAIRGKGLQLLADRYKKFLPKAQESSRRLQRMLELHDPTEWSLPTIPEDVEDRAFSILANVGLLHTGLDDCKDFALSLDRSSDKDDFLDEVHKRFHGDNVGLGGSRFSANADSKQAAKGSGAANIATQQLPKVIAKAMLPRQLSTATDETSTQQLPTTTANEESNQQLSTATANVTSTQQLPTAAANATSTRSQAATDGGSETRTSTSIEADLPIFQQTLATDTSETKTSAAHSQATTGAGNRPSLQESPMPMLVDGNVEATHVDQPGTPPGLRLLDLPRNYAGTSAAAFTSTIPPAQKVAGSHIVDPSEINPASPGASDTTQGRDQNNDTDDSKAWLRTDDPMHWLATDATRRDESEDTDEPLPFLGTDSTENRDEDNDSNDPTPELVTDSTEGRDESIDINDAMFPIGTDSIRGLDENDDTNDSTFEQVSPTDSGIVANAAAGPAPNDSCTEHQDGETDAAISSESAVNSPLGGVVLIPETIDQDMLASYPDSVNQSAGDTSAYEASLVVVHEPCSPEAAKHSTRYASNILLPPSSQGMRAPAIRITPALDGSPMAREVSDLTQALAASPMINEPSGIDLLRTTASVMNDPLVSRELLRIANAREARAASRMIHESSHQHDEVSAPAASVINDPTIAQSGQKNNGKLTPEGTGSTQQQTSLPLSETLDMGPKPSVPVKKSRGPAVPDPKHPGMKDTLTERMLNWDQVLSKALLTLTLENTTTKNVSPKTPQAVLLHHFEVGMDGVEAICRGQFTVEETPEVTAEREDRLGKLGTLKRGEGGTSKVLKKAQEDGCHGMGLWMFFGVRFKQTKREKKLKKGGKWFCFGAPYEALSYGQVAKREQTQIVTLGGGKDRDGKDVKQFRANVKRGRIVMSKGGSGPVDSWTASGEWVDEGGFFAATKNAMAHSALRITVLYEDSLDRTMQAFVPGPQHEPAHGVSDSTDILFDRARLANVPQKRKESAEEFTAEEEEEMEWKKKTLGDFVARTVMEQTGKEHTAKK